TTRNTGRKLDRAIIGILTVALAWFVWDRFARVEPVPAIAVSPDQPEQVSPESAPAQAEPSIAILPFENMSRDEANEPFTVGIHDDLLTQVSKINSLKTISRTSVLQYRDSDKTIP
ncbi:MAG: hypothetical protein GWM87_13335, partial [Xanthomonadales bacterium]|nr:hypothetical protein [Xanthomonadales bacterium]NIX13802.1 hypothetical protein [Xanthomonadales bacterium]